MSAPRLRPLTAADAPDAVALIEAALAQAERAAGEEPQAVPEAIRAARLARVAHFPVTDGPGSWAAEGDEGLRGIGVAIRRGHLWGLALLFVHPDHQSGGVGRLLLEATRPYAEGATVELIMSSHDPRAIRRYASLGLALHPGIEVRGRPDRGALPGGLAVREGGVADLDLVEAVDRDLRGGVARTGDVRFLLEEGGCRSLVVDRGGHRGFVVFLPDTVVCLGATDPSAAQQLLWAALGESGGDAVRLHGLTAAQGWAVDVALAARLRIAPGGPMFVRGWPALPGPYLPSGVYF